MGDAKRRGPYERRKAEAVEKRVAAIGVGDTVTFKGGQRILVTEVTPEGLKGQVMPNATAAWRNYGA
jgi:preprotein translocase subunit YajC